MVTRPRCPVPDQRPFQTSDVTNNIDYKHLIDRLANTCRSDLLANASHTHRTSIHTCLLLGHSSLSGVTPASPRHPAPIRIPEPDPSSRAGLPSRNGLPSAGPPVPHAPWQHCFRFARAGAMLVRSGAVYRSCVLTTVDTRYTTPPHGALKSAALPAAPQMQHPRPHVRHLCPAMTHVLTTVQCDR